MEQHFVIVANGQFPQSHQALSCLEEADFVVACDGAANELLKNHIMPQIVIGDGDSLLPENRRILADRFRQIDEQETNDLAKAFRFLRGKVSAGDSLTILGATGKREDHTLGNLGHLVDFSAVLPQTRMVTDNGTFFAVRLTTTISCRLGQSVSFFNPNACPLQLTVSGVKYPVQNLQLSSWWTATLNTTISDSLTISTDNNPVLVFLSFT